MSVQPPFLQDEFVCHVMTAVWQRCRISVTFAVIVIFGFAWLVPSDHASAQGGGNANAVGLSLEAATQAAGSQAAGNANQQTSAGGGPRSGPPAGMSSSGPPAGMSSSGPPAGMSRSGPPAGMSSSGPPAGASSGAPNAIGNYGTPDSSAYSGDPSASYDTGSGYEGGDMGYGSQTSGASRSQLAVVQLMSLSQQLSRYMAGFLGPSTTNAELNARQLTLWEQAALTFYHGDQRRALALYHAHMIADGKAATEARSTVMYSRLLKRPVWLIRFGISIHPRVPAELAEDPQPIREDTKIASANPRMRGGANRGGEESYSGPPDEFASSDPSGSMDPASMGDSESYGFANPATKPVVTTLGGAASEQVKLGINRNLGLVADVTSELFSASFKAGKYGNAFAEMETKGAELAAASQTQEGTSQADLPMWIPGVDYVGEGAYTEMIEKAKTNEIDVLMHFDIIVKENRVGVPQYTTRARLFHVDSGETIVISKSIDKYEIASKAASNRDSIHEIMKAMFDIVEKKVAVEPMPALQKVHATARIDSLLSSKRPDSLRNLAEMVMFQSRDLMSADELDKAFYFAGDDSALRLIHDEEAQRYQHAIVMIDQELITKPAP